MRVYCDSSTKEACTVVEGQGPKVIPYPETVTNNVGEYKAVILALEEAKQLGLKEIEIMTDSQLVVKQVSGAWECRMTHLLPFRDEVRKLLGIVVYLDEDGNEALLRVPSAVTLKWIPREENVAGRVLG